MPEARNLWSSFSNGLLAAIYPNKCALCGGLTPTCPCESCLAEMIPAADPVIYHPEPALAFRAHVYDYTGRPAQAVRRLKYSRSTSLAEFMSGEILEAAFRLGLEDHVAVPVPIHWRRRGSRGFNQSELLAERLSPRPSLLRRSRPTAPQAGLKLKDRIANLDGAFDASAEVRGLPILLIDDVITTGHTARECARALLAAGAVEVGILAFCGED